MSQGYEGYLCNVVQMETPEDSLKNILVVHEFPDIFPEEIQVCHHLEKWNFV